MAESLLVGRNFVSGICKLKPKKLLKTYKTYFCKNNKLCTRPHDVPAYAPRCGPAPARTRALRLRRAQWALLPVAAGLHEYS